MANHSSLLLMALLFLSLASLGRSQAVEGRAYCSRTGNPDPNDLPLVNATVILEFGSAIKLGESVTNATGFFSIHAVTIAPILGSLSAPVTIPIPLPVAVVINLPVGTCNSLPGSGFIIAQVYLDLTDSVFDFKIGKFSLISG